MRKERTGRMSLNGLIARALCLLEQSIDTGEEPSEHIMEELETSFQTELPVGIADHVAGSCQSVQALVAALKAREERTEVYWRAGWAGWIPQNAVPIGHDPQSDAVLFSCRVLHQGGLHLGFIVAGGKPTVSYGGRSIEFEETPYEILCCKPSVLQSIQHVQGTHGATGADSNMVAVQGGWESTGYPLYVGYAEPSASLRVPGKVSPSGGGCNVAFETKEVSCTRHATTCVPSNCRVQNPFLSLLVVTRDQIPEKTRFLKSVKELLDWDETNVEMSDCVTEAPKSLRGAQEDTRKKNHQRPKVLACHDMMGGYCQAADELYSSVFGSWDVVDVFVYFSHHRVSIPPKIWIEKCREHNVPCLGTIITEHVSGIAENQLLLENADVAVKQLARICQVFGFDGYLVNLESPVENTAALVQFLSKLREACQISVGSRAITLYYDSLDREGKIKYQNCLNRENVNFFDACDGIFTNYWWDESTLQETATSFPQHKLKTFFGIDCFARGKVCHTVGPGCRDAVQLLQKHGFSAAIFAPGWSMECGGAHPSSAGSLESAQKMDREFWHTILSIENQHQK